MKKYNLNKIINVGLYILFFMVIEMIQYGTMFKSLVPKYFYLDLLVVFALASLGLLVKSILFDKIYYSLLITITGILCIANVTFYTVFGDVFSLFNLTLIKKGIKAAADPSFFNFGFIALIVSIILIFIALIIILNKVVIKPEKRQKQVLNFKNFGGVFIFLCVCIATYITSLGITVDLKKGNASNNVIMMAKVANFKDYGMISYYVEEGKYLVGGATYNDEGELVDYFNQYEDTKNDFTSSLKDFNVVNIMIETGDDLMLNKTLTPNFYELLEDGINLTNNFSKNKTNISEFIGIVGSAPISGVNKKYDYYLPFNMPNMLKDKYRTIFFHDVPIKNNNKDIYERETLIPKLDFEEYYFHEELHGDLPGWDWGNGSFTLDSLTMPKVTDIILQNTERPVYAFYTTLSMHGGYTDPINRTVLREQYGEKYDEAIRTKAFVNPLTGTANEICIENFMLATMDFDKALGEMIQSFKDAGEYDNTLFILYGDHDLYYTGADKKPLNYALSGHDKVNFYDNYQTVMSFCNPKLRKMYDEYTNTTNGEFKKFTSPYNIVPTTLDLLGVDYNPNFYLGNSLFSKQMDEEQIFYSIELSAFFNDNYWTIDCATIDNTFNDQKDPDEFILAAQKTFLKESYLDIIFTNDYFNDHDFNDYNKTYNKRS